MTQTTHIRRAHWPAPSADLAVYRLTVRPGSLPQLFRTLKDQIRPHEDKLRNIEVGGNSTGFDAILFEDEVTFVKLLYPKMKVDWLHQWDEETVRILNGG